MFTQRVCLSVPCADVNIIKVDSVPNEMSSSPKSLPPATVFRLTILINAEVTVGPEVQVP